MATTSSFAFTNTTTGATVDTTAIQPKTKYAPIPSSTPGQEYTVTNSTCPVDQGEQISYRSRAINNVTSAMPVVYPARVQSGVEFGVRVDEILRTKDSDGTILCDEPIICTVTMKAPRSSNITEAILETVWERTLGALYDATNSRYRFADLMKTALEPMAD